MPTKEKKTETKKETTAKKKTTTKKPVSKKEAAKKTEKIEEVKTIKKVTAKKPLKKEIVKNVSQDAVEQKENKKTCPLNKLNKKFLLIIIPVVVVAIIIVAIIISSSSNTYKLNEILSCYEGSNETITLPKKYLISNDATIYEKDGKYINAVGGFACYNEDEEEFNALLSEIKEVYESCYEFESNDHRCFYFNYSDGDYALSYVFIYKDNKILQLVFEGLGENETINIAKSVK